MGVDHVLASGKDINIMVFDTVHILILVDSLQETTPTGAIAQFAAAGKEVKKKDLASIAIADLCICKHKILLWELTMHSA